MPAEYDDEYEDDLRRTLVIRAVVFDLDNTVVKSNLDFAAIKREIGMPPAPILEYMATVSEAERARINEILDKHESRAAEECDLNDGARELLDYLRSHRIPATLLTRNSRRSAARACQKHGVHFDVVVAREDAAPKPSPEPVLLTARKLGLPPHELLVVGDYKYDIESGRAAGAQTALLTNGKKPAFEVPADFTVCTLPELIPIIESQNRDG
ncbi:MAG: HAD family hydrolase [Planctomycetes bacterium]|nr:HAD family hydrolase [Planctomycetota bacterium]